MDVDSEVLIALVFDKQPLWDKRNKFHSNRNVTDKCWKEISLEMKQGENKIRKRWRYLRDQFSVELGKIPPSRSGDEATTLCPKWPYFKSLLFLKPIVKARTTTGSLTRRRSGSEDPDAEIGEIEESQSTNENDFPTSPRNTEDGEASDQPTVSSVMPSFKTASKKLKKTLNDQILDIEHQKLKLLQDKEKKIQNQIDADNEHLLFFKSLLPHVNRIPQHMLLSFRNRIQSTVDEFAYQSSQFDNRSTTSMTNYSSLSNVSRRSTPTNAQYDESTSNQLPSVEYNETTQSVRNDQSLAEFYSRYQL